MDMEIQQQKEIMMKIIVEDQTKNSKKSVPWSRNSMIKRYVSDFETRLIGRTTKCDER